MADFWGKKLPYQCIAHIGDKIDAAQKLQMYCDVASTLGYGDAQKLRTILGILFTQRAAAPGHYIGEVSKHEFDKMVDSALANVHVAGCCQDIPGIYGIEDEMCECDICPCSTGYRNAAYDEELEIMKYIYNRTNVDGTITAAAPCIDIINNSGVNFNSLIEVELSDKDNGVVVPLFSILMSSALSWLGIDRLDWYIDNVLKVQLRNKKVNVFYPAQNSTRLLNDQEVQYCIDFFKSSIITAGEYNDITKFKELVTRLKKKQRQKYVPFMGDNTPNDKPKSKKKAKSKEKNVTAFEVTDFLGPQMDEETPRIPYSKVDVHEEVHEWAKPAKQYEDVPDVNKEPISPSTECGTAGIGDEPKPGEIAEYIHRIENPVECVWINASKNYFGEGLLTVVNQDNREYVDITICRELVVRKVVVCDYVRLDDSDGLLLYFNDAQERNFAEQFFFVGKEYISAKIVSTMKNSTVLKLTLSPIAMAAYMAEHCMCDNVCSLSDVYWLCRGQAATLKTLGDGKGDEDHLIRVFRNIQAMYEGAIGSVSLDKLKLLGAYHCALALSLNAGDYVRGCSIDYDGSVVRYTLSKDDELLCPGIIVSIEDIQLLVNCEIGIPEITRTIIAKLYGGRYMYDSSVKILNESSNGYAVYVPVDGDAPGIVDVINRITVNVLRELTGCRPEYTLNYRGIKL